MLEFSRTVKVKEWYGHVIGVEDQKIEDEPLVFSKTRGHFATIVYAPQPHITAEEVSKEINDAFCYTSPIKVYDNNEVIGYYVSAEVTDIGEVWAKFVRVEDWQYPKKKKDVYPPITTHRPWNRS